MAILSLHLLYIGTHIELNFVSSLLFPPSKLSYLMNHLQIKLFNDATWYVSTQIKLHSRVWSFIHEENEF